MSTFNTIVYPNAFKASGVSYDITIKTSAKMQSDTNKIAEIYKAVMCSHFDTDNIDDISLNQFMDTKLQFDDSGAKISGNPSNKKIRDIFKKTFSQSDYQGMKVSEKAPTIDDGIEDIYDIQTNPQIGGAINPSASKSWGTWATNAPANIWSAAKQKYRDYQGSSFANTINKPENVKHVQAICNHLVSRKNINKNPVQLSGDAQEFYNKHILPYIKNNMKPDALGNKPDLDSSANIAKGFANVLKLVKGLNTDGVSNAMDAIVLRGDDLL